MFTPAVSPSAHRVIVALGKVKMLIVLMIARVIAAEGVVVTTNAAMVSAVTGRVVIVPAVVKVGNAADIFVAPRMINAVGIVVAIQTRFAAMVHAAILMKNVATMDLVQNPVKILSQQGTAVKITMRIVYVPDVQA